MDQRHIDGHKLDLHPLRVAQWLYAGDDWEKVKAIYPIYWEITTSAACNHRCTFCSVDGLGYQNIMVSRDMLRDRMQETAKLGVKSVMFAGTGEPLLHKEINAIVEDASAAKLDSAFTTNGVLLHKLETIAKCSWVKVSVNAGSRETYARIHQTNTKDWDSLWQMLPSVAARKGRCSLGIQCVILPDNFLEMRSLAARARDAGADYLVLKPYSHIPTATVEVEADSRTTYALEKLGAVFDTPTFKVIYKTNAMEAQSGPHQYPRCNATPYFWCHSMANGDLHSCSRYLLDDRFNLGNLNKQTFKQVWEGEKRKANWRYLKEMDVSQCSKNCRMNASNIYLHRISTDEHRNFI